MGARLGKSEVLHTFFPAKPNHSEDEKLLIISSLKGSLFQQPQSPRQHLPCPFVQQGITTPLIAVQVIIVEPSVHCVGRPQQNNFVKQGVKGIIHAVCLMHDYAKLESVPKY